MKNIAILLLIGCLSACQSKEDSVLKFIPGVYVTAEEGEYSKLKDTLIIKLVSEEGHSYHFTRKVTFQRIVNGTYLPAERKEEEWIGIYNVQEKIVQESEGGRLLSFIPARKKLLLERSEYNKIQ